ncbi:MAG: DUF378 domain-containing protein [Candidatus Zambryskibacteria bacterium]|nr:DUF378 domain-containing protein [Candidatus Zambryskibacteria bacterium]
MKGIHAIAFILLVIGGLNWLIVAIWSKDLLMLLGLGGGVATVVYWLVGLSALYELFTHKKCCKACVSGGQSM